jgi:predicted glycoside hydrolase/deacetylase ChbG (UPF0249 family)
MPERLRSGKALGECGLHSGKRLIVSADDFGLHPSVNEAVESAYRNGILTSASLAVNGESFSHAVEIAGRNARLGVGIHITLTGERPVADPASISSIVDSNGMLPTDHRALFAGIITGKVRMDHVSIECEAQVAKFISSGLVPTHADSHQHLHLFGPVFAALEPILRKYKIKKLRSLNIPFSDYRIDPLKIAFSLYSRFAGILKGYSTPDHFYGFFRSGEMDAGYVKKVLSGLILGVSEISFHPGIDNISIGERYGLSRGHRGWRCDWAAEHSLLIDPLFRNAIDSMGIKLINYGDL